jgi:putative ABC transport system permease protein
MGRRALAGAYDMTDAFNDVSFRLAPGASGADAIARIDRILAPYGGGAAYDRHDQVSDFVVSSKIQQLRSMAVIVPSVFLGIAAFLASLMLSRLVRTERVQIGTLKAFGYSGGRIARHYLTLALAIVSAGGLAGLAAGIWLGSATAKLYVVYFHFPILRYELSPGLVAIALLVAAGAGLGGAYGAARAAAALPPAEAMSPEAPAVFHRALVDRIGIGRHLPLSLRMILRNLERRVLTAATTSLGIAFATALLIVGQGVIDGVTQTIEFQFAQVERDDVTVVFNQERDERALFELRRLPGILRAEPFRSVAVRLRSGQRSYRLSLSGERRDGELRNIVGARGQRLALPPRGMLLSSTVAGLLHLVPGDVVDVDVLEGRRRTFRVPVAALDDSPIGVPATMELDDLDRRLGEESTISGAWLAVDALAAPQLDRTFKQTPEIAGVSYRRAALENARSTLGDSVVSFQIVLLALALILVLGVVYNAARIALSERSRELATLRIIGLTRTEITTVLLGEQAFLTAIAIPVGLGLGYLLLQALADTAFRTELYRIPLVVASSTCALAAIAVAAAALVSGVLVRRQLDRLDLVAVLKSD